jgi:hypothetical protein
MTTDQTEAHPPAVYHDLLHQLALLEDVLDDYDTADWFALTGDQAAELEYAINSVTARLRNVLTGASAGDAS